MDDICDYCGSYGCNKDNCILSCDIYDMCECCGLFGHNKNECSFIKLVDNMNNMQKNIVEYIKYNFPDINIVVNNLYNISPIQKNIIMTFPDSSKHSTIKYASLVLTTNNDNSIYKYYYILYNDGHIEIG